MHIDEAIRIFASFLNESWDIVNPLLLNRSYTIDESSIGDWLQANWEILVERKVLSINEYLEVYAEGADFNGKSSRITDIDAAPSFSIQLLSKKEKVLDILNHQYLNPSNYIFEKLVGFENNFYVIAPPFNYVLVQDQETDIERVFCIKDIEFILAGKWHAQTGADT